MAATCFEMTTGVVAIGGGVAAFCTAAFATKASAVVAVYQLDDEEEHKKEIVLTHNYRPPVWAILLVLSITGLFLLFLNFYLMGFGGKFGLTGECRTLFFCISLLETGAILITALIVFPLAVRDFHQVHKAARIKKELWLFTSRIDKFFLKVLK